MPRGVVRRTAVVAIAIVTSCSASGVCSGDVGPETLTVDASAFADLPDVSGVEVCIAPADRHPSEEEAACSPPATPIVSYTTEASDYPAVLDYYVVLQTGDSDFVSPEEGRGSHEMQCAATTTNIVLPVSG